ncbi:hypothetical protein C8Q75DRAFT_118820 [Abortiporus biennis]|nr:hypothetical protein C8Q75DRAFT_118820 [Abortiporus biennis]
MNIVKPRVGYPKFNLLYPPSYLGVHLSPTVYFFTANNQKHGDHCRSSPFSISNLKLPLVTCQWIPHAVIQFSHIEQHQRIHPFGMTICTNNDIGTLSKTEPRHLRSMNPQSTSGFHQRITSHVHNLIRDSTTTPFCFDSELYEKFESSECLCLPEDRGLRVVIRAH